MVFQKLALLTLAAAGVSSAMSIERRGAATCTFAVAASGPVAASADLPTEFNLCKNIRSRSDRID